MSTRRTGRVLVATSGSASSRSAITFAARTAASRGLTLELAHVAPPAVHSGPYGVAPDIVMRQAGRELLTEGEALARAVAPGVEVVTELLVGPRVEALVEKAHHADLLVVGAPPHDLMGRLWTGSIVTGAAARATCPVAIVRVSQPETKHQVLVGLKSRRHAERLLAAAFALADEAGSDLRIVHAWHYLSSYDDAIAEHRPRPDWELEEGRAIEGLLIDLRMAYPNVSVRVDLVHGQPAYTLVEASREADVLVISRPVHGGFVHHLGATARAVIRGSHCRVLVVPPREVTTGSDHAGADVAVAP